MIYRWVYATGHSYSVVCAMCSSEDGRTRGITPGSIQFGACWYGKIKGSRGLRARERAEASRNRYEWAAI